MIKLFNSLLGILILLISITASASIFSNDPSRNELISKMEKSDVRSLNGVNIKDINDADKLFYVGYLYSYGSEYFGFKRNCDKAVEALTKSWSKGGVDAGFTLALMYYDGYCVKRDFELSNEYLKATANEGYILSQRYLGRSYIGMKLKGLNKEDIKKSIYWLKKAANNGDKDSAGTLSYIYKKGIGGIESNLKFYFKWLYVYTHSDKYYNGDLLGFDELASCYEEGIGTEKDLVQAYKYYTLSGNAGAEGKHRVAEQMTPEQIQKGQRLANEWMQEHNAYVPNY